MAGSQASLVRETLHSMGLIDIKAKPEVNDVLRRKRQEAAAKSHASRKAKQLAKDLQTGQSTSPQNASYQQAAKPATASDTADFRGVLPANSSNQQPTAGFAISASSDTNATNLQKLQTVQQGNVAEARRILNEAGPKAAKYLSDLVSGAIPDASERLRLEAAKVILASQGATGEQQSGNSRQDINSMSKHDLMAFIHAGTVELNRIKAARESEIIDVQLDD